MLLLKCKFVCLTIPYLAIGLGIVRPNSTKISVWKRERFPAGPCKETGGSCLKNPKLPKSSLQSPFIGKVRKGCG